MNIKLYVSTSFQKNSTQAFVIFLFKLMHTRKRMLRNAQVTFEEKPQLEIISFGILNTDIYTYLIRQICLLMVLI